MLTLRPWLGGNHAGREEEGGDGEFGLASSTAVEEAEEIGFATEAY